MYISALHQLELRWFAQPLLYSRRDQEKVAPFVVAYRSKGTWNPCRKPINLGTLQHFCSLEAQKCCTVPNVGAERIFLYMNSFWNLMRNNTDSLNCLISRCCEDFPLHEVLLKSN